MLIFLLGSQDFAAPLSELGHEVVRCAPDPAADIPVQGPDPDWLSVANRAAQMGLRPDAVLVCDDVGFRNLPVGLGQSEAVTACYLVDAPLNEFWQQPYARLFDVALFDQPAQAARAVSEGVNAHWLPLGVEPKRYESNMLAREEKAACFVGVVDPRVRPKRSAVLDRVRRRVELRVQGGRQGKWFATADAAYMYKTHRVVINENLFPGLTTRPLEVMAAGGFLLSEAAPGVMDRHFADFEHLLYYDHDNLDQRLSLALGDDGLRRRCMRAGREAVLGAHTLTHRADQLAKQLKHALEDTERLAKRPDHGQAIGLEGQALLMSALRWPGKDGRRRLLRAAARLRQANDAGVVGLPTIRAAAVAEMALGRHDAALGLLRQAMEHGAPCDALALTIFEKQHAGVVTQNPGLHQLVQWHPGLAGRDGEASFHLAAAAVLADHGRGMSAGFNKARSPQPCWDALEHLLEATRLDPTLEPAWRLGGDILLDNGAPCEASMFYEKAWQLSPRRQTMERLALARQRGYLA